MFGDVVKNVLLENNLLWYMSILCDSIKYCFVLFIAHSNNFSFAIGFSDISNICTINERKLGVDTVATQPR